MKILDVPFNFINWSEIPVTYHPGETGIAEWRTTELGNVRVRLVNYSPGYFADHWCKRGHVMFVVEGEITTELEDGSVYNLKAGTSYVVSDDIAPHRSHTVTGAKLFIVD